MEICKNLNEFNGKVGDYSYLVAYGKDSAEPIAILPNPNCNLIKIGEGDVPVEVIEKAIREKKKAKIATTNIFYTYGSPGCQIMIAPGIYICICC